MRTTKGLVAATVVLSAVLAVPPAAWAADFFVRSRGPFASFTTRYPASSLGRPAAGAIGRTDAAPASYRSPAMRYDSPVERKVFEYKFQPRESAD